MISPSRLLKNAADAQGQCYLAFEQQDLELQSQEAAQLKADQLSVTDRLVAMVEERYVGRVTLGGLNRVNPYNLKSVVGVTITPQQDAFGLQRINVSIAKDQSFIDLEACTTDGNETYMYVHEQGQAFLKVNETTRLPLTHPLAVHGLERLKKVCEVLGVTSLVTT